MLENDGKSDSYRDDMLSIEIKFGSKIVEWAIFLHASHVLELMLSVIVVLAPQDILLCIGFGFGVDANA